MADQRPVLVLSRPERQSREFLAACKARVKRDIDAVISPVMKIEATPHAIDPERFSTFIVTSRNALDHVGVPLRDRVVVTVGERTAEQARKLGAKAVCLGENVDAFIENASGVAAPALHLRGVHGRGDLAARLTTGGLPTEECIVYDQVEQPLSDEALSALAGGHAVVPVFSPRSAALVSRHTVHPETRVLAISPSAAAAWSGPGAVTVSASPDRDGMLELVAAAF